LERDMMAKRIRPASTVILLREHEEELQVYLLRRSAGSGFFPGSYVFPGGAVDTDDLNTEFWKPYLDLSIEDLLRIFGTGLKLEEIIAYGVAAIRETFEEAGVFLAGSRNNFKDFLRKACSLRSRGELKESWLQNRVPDEDLKLSFSNLYPWSHWITPEGMPKRFDTRFFVALMPDGQECIPDAHETVHGLWISPENALRGNMQGEIPLTPPTVITLHELLGYRTQESLSRALQSRTWGDALLPMLVKLEREAVLVEPWDPQYGKKIELPPEGLKEKVVPLGEPFSRLWLDRGIWRPLKA
jgi:8-oxo-dGTP pyrophosphatase MutT (NUDIX family)